MIRRKSSIAAIDKSGILLVFPINNRPEPPSIWSHFYPKDKMLWEWDDEGDNRVADLWHLKTELSTTRKVVYSKWYQGRATYFSRPLFKAMLRALNPHGDPLAHLSREARTILRILQGESPLSTKELKRISGLRGREQEKAYTKALGELWAKLLIVGFGEVDDGAFPSLAMGATEVLYEDLWTEAFQLDPKEAESLLQKSLLPHDLFYKYYLKLKDKFESHKPEKKTKVKSSKNNGSKKPGFIRYEDL